MIGYFQEIISRMPLTWQHNLTEGTLAKAALYIDTHFRPCYNKVIFYAQFCAENDEKSGVSVCTVVL